jgi:hypothetical protein
MIDALERDGLWYAVVDGVEQSTPFGCKMSALGFGKAMEAEGKVPWTGACTVKLGRGVRCAGVHAFNYGVV